MSLLYRNRLPDEIILLHVLPHLQRHLDHKTLRTLSLVSKKWLQWCSELLWKEVVLYHGSLEKFYDLMTRPRDQLMCDYFAFIRNLSIHHYDKSVSASSNEVSDQEEEYEMVYRRPVGIISGANFFELMSDRCLKLERLMIVDAAISAGQLRTITSSVNFQKSLRHLTIMNFLEVKVGDYEACKHEDFTSIKKLKNLKSLSIGSTKLRSDSLISIAESMKNLQRLDVLDLNIETVDDGLIFAIARSCQQLQVLSIPNVSGRLTEDSFEFISNYLPQLTKIEIHGTRLSKDTLDLISQKLVHLEHLDLSFCYGLSESAIRDFAQYQNKMYSFCASSSDRPNRVLYFRRLNGTLLQIL